jgi:FMN phosphatase YigB (HAD superfamily)
MPLEVLFLDLDGTIYPHENGMWDLIAEKMEIFMHQELDIPKDIIPSMRYEYFSKYGTTLRGLLANYSFDPEEYLSFVHDVPVSDFIKPDEGLRDILINLPQTKWILTNSDKNQALMAAGNPSPQTCLFADDLPKNLVPAWEMGFVTVLVGNGEKTKAAMYQISKISDLPEILVN